MSISMMTLSDGSTPVSPAHSPLQTSGLRAAGQREAWSGVACRGVDGCDGAQTVEEEDLLMDTCWLLLHV